MRICWGTGVLERLDITQRFRLGYNSDHLLLRAEGDTSLHYWVCGAGWPDAELGDGGLDGADGHVGAEDDVLLGLLPRVRLGRKFRDEMFK